MMSVFKEDILIQTDSRKLLWGESPDRPLIVQRTLLSLSTRRCASIKDCHSNKESNQEPFKILVSILVNLDKTIVTSEIIPSEIKMLIGNRFNELLK